MLFSEPRTIVLRLLPANHIGDVLLSFQTDIIFVSIGYVFIYYLLLDFVSIFLYENVIILELCYCH